MRKRIILSILVFILVLLSSSCGQSSDKQGITDFFANANNSEVFQRSALITTDLNGLSAKSQMYTPTQLASELQQFENRASMSYTEMKAIVPPKILQSFWDKKIESTRLQLQAISLLRKRMNDTTITIDQITVLLSQSNDLKISAGQELQDICEKYGVDAAIAH